MARVAFLFPGQGAQQVGMLTPWLQGNTFAQQWLDEVDSWVTPLPGHPSFATALTQGPDEALKQTAYTQPAILLTSLIAWRTFAQHVDSLKPVVTAGHSLGEFGALVAAGALTADDALRLVVQRASLMQTCPPGSMSVVLGLPAQQVQAVLDEQRTHLPSTETLVIANDNSAEQVVLAGTPNALASAEPALKAAGAKRLLSLSVGGAFHSPLMQPAADTFAQALAQVPFGDVAVPVVSNVTGQLSQDKSVLQANLSCQMASPVQWRTTMTTLVEEARIDAVIEFGPGKVLTGLLKKAYPALPVWNLNTPEQISEIAQWWQLQASMPTASATV